MLKRIGLFILTNIAFIIMINVVVFILAQLGVDIVPGSYMGLIVWSVVRGFAGSILSLMMSKQIAKWTHKMTLIEEHTADPRQRVIYDMVAQVAAERGIKIPEVGIYQSDQPNAFATGPSKNNALVAVSTGLLDLMDDDEVRAVVGHEMAHVLNGDMVSMTLLQGVLNAFIIFFSNILSDVVAKAMDDDRSALIGFVVHIFFNIVLGILASLILMSFSRRREYHADAGAAEFMRTPTHMIAALRKLDTAFQNNKYKLKNNATANLMIFGELRGMMRSHPTVEQRIEALQSGQYASGI